MFERFENRHIRLLVTMLLFASSAPVLAQIERQHGAHVHGTSTVDIALDGKTLTIHLDAPGMNLLGFEHAPRDAVERAKVSSVLADLNAPSVWLQPAAGAACRLMHVDVESKGLGGVAAATSNSPLNREPVSAETHADFDADYTFECAQPDRLDNIDIQLIARYAATTIVTVNIASRAGQSTVDLSGSNTRASFPQ
ncbi:DUF2796 domain-containing protein [Pseudolysobacter antarcticus]|uniref:DUF2796 domain-containing protein n=1 Tax=Pseudolysobacter antarcticus TaxID=2511995 RepID=A0A411HGT1_9GAMM|nr:DUF2796 domain-containing protein [Pseudolysobacter antarcticus]QBB69746.1 DUF2796 domain-containing protein [Pseudolysobacter antarcticus]